MEYSSWYSRLKKPSWAPPEIAFGQVWSFLYPIIFAVNIYVLYLLSKGQIGWRVALPFWLNLLFNFAFSPLQFVLRSQILSSIDIILVLITTLWCIIVIWPYSKLASIAFLPYLIWVAIASVLQISITILNR